MAISYAITPPIIGEEPFVLHYPKSKLTDQVARASILRLRPSLLRMLPLLEHLPHPEEPGHLRSLPELEFPVL